MFKLPAFLIPPEQKILCPVGRDVLELMKHIVTIDKKLGIDFLKYLTTRQLESIKNELTGYDEKPEIERDLIRYILQEFLTGNKDSLVLYETLLLRDAFIGPVMLSQRQYRIDTFTRLVVGLRDHIDIPLDLTTPEKIRDAKALLSFSFEVGDDCLMVNGYSHSRDLSYLRYESADLKNLIIRFSAQSEKLIEAALRRETTDPELLAIMMAEDGSLALNEGSL